MPGPNPPGLKTLAAPSRDPRSRAGLVARALDDAPRSRDPRSRTAGAMSGAGAGAAAGRPPVRVDVPHAAATTAATKMAVIAIALTMEPPSRPCWVVRVVPD